jgi:pyruvate dehydrogenase E2 component (dihydrolipoamide acetyltransferase)
MPAVAPSPAGTAGNGLRERASAQLARAVSQSWTTVPHFAVSREIDVTDLLHYLDGVRRTAPQVSVTDLLLQAAARSWRGVRPVAPDAVGLSVAADDRRVVNVSVPGAASLTLAELAERRRSAVSRARRGVLAVADQTPVEVTVSNLGTHGVDWFTGIIPTNQLGLFTIGRIRSGLDVSTDSFRIRKLVWVTANLDHRELDGADGGVLLDLFQQACSVSLGDPFGAAGPERKAQ